MEREQKDNSRKCLTICIEYFNTDDAGQSEHLPIECLENWEKPYYCSKPKGSCKKCK